MLRRALAGLRMSWRDRRGVAAVEFALLSPIGILLLIGTVDLTRGIIFQQQVYRAAHSIPILASSIAVQPNRATSLTVAQVQQSLSAIFADIPLLRSANAGVAGAIMTSVDFTQQSSSCQPATQSPCAAHPFVAWSVAYTPPAGRSATGVVFDGLTRLCGQLAQVSPTQASEGVLTALRTAAVDIPVPALGPLLVVDVHYRYTPIFFSVLTGPIDFWASGYWPTRSQNPALPQNRQYTSYDAAGQAGGAGKCSGYP